MSQRKRLANWDDSDDDSGYPSALLEAARRDDWDSPTKASRRVKYQPRPRKTGRYQSPPVPQENQPTVLENAPLAAAELDSAPDPQVEHDLRIGPEIDTATISSEIGDTAGFSPEVPDTRLDTYVDAVTAHVAGFYHLEGKLFVVQGWDIEKGQSLDHWYHLEYKILVGEGGSDSLLVACTCPSGLDSTCIHGQFFVKYDVSSLLDFEDEHVSEHSLAIMFLQTNDDVTSYFSVLSASTSALKGRAIVRHTGAPGSWSGSWRCSKDAGTATCVHIRRVLLVVGQGDGDGDIGNRDGFAASRPVNELVGNRCGHISYLPVNVPSWATLPGDPQHYPPPPPFRSIPESPFLLDARSSCPCPTGRTFYDGFRPTVFRPCKVYTLCGLYSHQIELQPCPQCPPSRRRFIGPDLRDLGLFNFNNSIIVSHELLDEYTSAYTSSETPFSSWVLHLSRRYRATGDTFMGEDLFRSVWFSYVSLQDFSSDMRCSRCGDHPETVIWDGITLSFGRKHVTSTLRPPTTVSELSLVRQKVKYHPHQQLIVDASLRKQIRVAVDPPSLDAVLEHEEEGFSAEETPESPSKARSRELKAIGDHLGRVKAIGRALKELCPALSVLFDQTFGEAAYAQRKKAPRAYKDFFIQVAAEESVLQLINNSSLLALRSFLQNPTKARATQILVIPALYKVVQVHHDVVSLVPIMEWLEGRASHVLLALKVEEALPGVQDGAAARETQSDWTQTGCLYSMPQIRYRPKYPRLRNDQQRDKSSKRGDACGKYFTQYGEQRLTGGLMVAWCTHGICYGFHCIAESEGRDDVFSAMVTRWPVAPKRVVYDFACSLGPYCMLREPEFFQNTYFCIDHFHSSGHTKCSPAAFLSEYANIDPRLVIINSSAAECGNGGLKKIRKSVSYMSQTRAIIYSKVFLSVWNRVRERKAVGVV